MIIQHNMSAANASRQLNCVTGNQAKNAEKLASGYRINRAADDAAGLTISEGMRSMIRGLNRASQNAQDGISLLQTADGALNETESIIQRIRELSVQAANDTNMAADREALQSEIDALLSEVDRIAEDTEFNTIKLLNGNLEAQTSANPIASFAMERSGMVQVDNGISVDYIIDTSATQKISTTQANNLNSVLINSIVPQATNALLSTFSAFGGAVSAGQVSQEIGLKIYNTNNTTLAYVAMQWGEYSDGRIAADMIQLNLSVNVNTLTFNGDDLSEDSRRALETTIVHEMMHAFMDDTLTNGMIGATEGKKDSSNGFPSWFKEGMAQVAAGGCSNDNDWVNGAGNGNGSSGMGLTSSSTTAEITSSIKASGNVLGSGTTTSQYGTGYLACMYLGYLAAGSPSSVSQSNLTSGVNKVLQELIDGNSLDDIINDISGGTYTSTADFESKFGDTASATFVGKLLNAVGDAGNGGLVSSLTASDLLANGNTTSSVYKVDESQEYVVSSVGNNRDWSTGGTKSSGTSGSGNSGSDGTGTGGTGGTGGGTGGGSGGGGTSTAPLGKFNLQVGALGGQAMSISIGDMSAAKLGLSNLSVSDHDKAGSAITTCDEAISKVSETRSKIGAYVNRLEHTIANLDNTAENTQAAECRIRDMNLADGMVEFSAYNVIAQAGQAILAQANLNAKRIVDLLS